MTMSENTPLHQSVTFLLQNRFFLSVRFSKKLMIRLGMSLVWFNKTRFGLDIKYLLLV